MLRFNTYNTLIFVGAIGLLMLVLHRLVIVGKKDETTRYFYWFLVVTAIAILQYISFDIGIFKKYRVLFLFLFPLEFLAPVLFTAFTCSYLKKEDVFKKYCYHILIPFVLFFVIYTIIKVDDFIKHPLLSKETVYFIRAELNENIALAFTFLMGIWNYKIIKDYEKELGKMSYDFVVRKTKWLKGIYLTLILLSVFWLLILIYIKIDDDVGGNDTYYPLWIAYLLCYYVFFLKSKDHLKRRRERKGEEIQKNLNLSSLNEVLQPAEIAVLSNNQHQVTSILGYFATSVFDKSKTKEVLWDIIENCISKLELEDCVLYLLDEKQQELCQVAAFGNKQKGEKEIRFPKQIPVGKGIVGSVAKTGEYELIGDTDKDSRYIVDDKKRKSELAVPIHLEEKLIGVLDAEHSQKYFFTENHLYLFKLIAKLTEKKLMQLDKKKGLNITNDNAYYKEVCHLMEKEKLYRNPNIKLSTISERIQISTNYLSQLINALSGHNFSDFVNGYRIEEVKSKLRHSEFLGYPVLSIGLESGFNSKSAFYNSFKKHTGMSPSAFREKHP